MNIKKRILRFVLPFLASFLMVAQSLAPAAVVLAQEVSSPEPQPEATQPLAEDASPTPEFQSSPDLDTSPTPQASDQINTSPSPEPSNLENSQSEELSVEIVQSANINETNLDSGQIESASSATLATDQADYAPESAVRISGLGYLPNQTLTLRVTWPDGTIRASGNRAGETDQLNTDSAGNFEFDYQLTGGQKGSYLIEVLNSDGQVLATASFTDAQPTKPANVSTEPLSTTSVKVEWKDKSTDEDDFHIERKIEGDSFSYPDSEIATIISTTKASTETIYSFTDENLECDVTYRYRVRAHRHDGSGDAFSAYSSNSGNDQTTLYWQTDSVFDLTPDTAVEGSSDVPLLAFTMTSCNSQAEIKKVKVEYTGDDKDDVDLMKLYQESGEAEGFDPTDTLLATKSPDGGNEFNLDPDDNIAVGSATVTFYIAVDLSSTVGNKVDAKIKKDKIDIDPNNPGEASDPNWPLESDESIWDPAGDTTIVVPDTTPPESTFTSPADGSFWGVGGIDIAGSSTDVPGTTVDYVTLWASFSGDDEWFEITQIDNAELTEPFPWEVVWVPDEEGLYDIMAEATDTAGNTESSPVVEEVTYDITAPESEITSPPENSFWNTPIPIEGNSTDNFAVDFVRLFYRTSGVDEGDNGEENGDDGDEWTEIDTNPDEEGAQPLLNEGEGRFNWNFNWTPLEEGTFDIKAEATDKAANSELSPVVEYVTYDVTDPASDITYPEEGARYIEDVWDDEIRGTAADSPSSGVATVFVSIQRDEDGFFWDADDIEWVIGEEEEEEYLNEADFDEETETWSFEFDFVEPEGEDEGYTARSHAQDNAGNKEDTNAVHFFFGRAPVISAETESTVSTSSVTITWTTDHPATSRVVYDTVSHPELGEAPNYGYASSTAEFDTDPKVTSHSVTVDDLTAGTTYSYRTVSHGSPEAVGDEKSFTTTNPAAAASTAGTDGGGGGAAPTCGDTKPGSAPTLTGASAGTNGVSLTWSQAEGPVTYYLVTYGTSPGAQQFGNPNVGGAGTTSYTVSGLSGGITYYFKVRAGNGCAPGDFSNELSATPAGGFVAGPAAGFAPGVLGAATEEATPSAKATPETKGVQEEVQIKEGFLGSKVKYAAAAVIILLIAGLILWRNRRINTPQG